MKLTPRQLRNIIEQEVKHLKSSSGDPQRFLHGSDSGHPVDDEGYMVKSSMVSLKKMAEDICGLLDSEDQLPGWVQSLVATAHNDLQHVHGYLTGDAEMHAHDGPPQQMMPMEAKAHRSGMILEGHARITAEEMKAWMGGDWGYVDEAVGGFMPGRDDKFRQPSRPPAQLKCADCGKNLTSADKDAYESEGGQGYPEVCTDCAEIY